MEHLQIAYDLLVIMIGLAVLLEQEKRATWYNGSLVHNIKPNGE